MVDCGERDRIDQTSVMLMCSSVGLMNGMESSRTRSICCDRKLIGLRYSRYIGIRFCCCCWVLLIYLRYYALGIIGLF